MKNITDEFSFLLKPSTIPGAGIGVFAAHDIAKDTLLKLWTEDEKDRVLDEKDVPKDFQIYCLAKEGGKLYCPAAFNRMSICWYLNHSEAPNASWKENFNYYSIKDIKAGEEIFIDYNSLGEPEDAKEDYYKK